MAKTLFHDRLLVGAFGAALATNVAVWTGQYWGLLVPNDENDISTVRLHTPLCFVIAAMVTIWAVLSAMWLTKGKVTQTQRHGTIRTLGAGVLFVAANLGLARLLGQEYLTFLNLMLLPLAYRALIRTSERFTLATGIAWFIVSYCSFAFLAIGLAEDFVVGIVNLAADFGVTFATAFGLSIPLVPMLAAATVGTVYAKVRKVAIKPVLCTATVGFYAALLAIFPVFVHHGMCALSVVTCL